MAMRSTLIADLAQMANGAASALGGVREEIDNMIRHRLERTLNARGLVTREEFDALRTRHEALAARLTVLEAVVASDQPADESGGSKPVKTAKRPTAKQMAAKKAPKAKSKRF